MVRELSSQSEIYIRKMEISDIEGVTSVHLQAFTGFFLTFLGATFLKELYTAIALDPTGLAFVQDGSGKILGFIAGSSQPAGFYQRLIRARWWRFGLACIPPVARNPKIIPRLFRALEMPSIATKNNLRGTLMSIAVMPAIQGTGVGTSLLNGFLEEARRRGLQQVDLTTDRLNNDAVNLFYIRKGFHFSRTFMTPEGREMNEYLIDL